MSSPEPCETDIPREDLSLTVWKRIQRRFASLVVAVAAVTAGCADGTPATESRPSEQSAPAVTTTKLPLELVRATGTVVSGPEPGCLLLDTGERRYHLVGGGEPALEPGQEVTVTGLADPNTTSSCEHRTPLTISEVDPVSPHSR